MKSFILALSLLLGLVVVTSGCGQKSPYQRHGYSGVVTLDGEPLPIGALYLEPLESQPVQSFCFISDGKFEVPADQGAVPGRYRVVIMNEGMSAAEVREASTADSSESTQEKPAVPKAKASRPKIVPAAYNLRSTLEMTISAEGKNEFQFDLKSKPGK